MAHSPFRINPFSGEVQTYSTSNRYERMSKDIQYGSESEKEEAITFVNEQIEEFESSDEIFLGWQTRDGSQAVINGCDLEDAISAWEALLNYA
jgi:hypothetical protein|tara:strand:+ start:737 stop:1015 length:279 start_codon:yes stop_codon:yes gene_type:complete